MHPGFPEYTKKPLWGNSGVEFTFRVPALAADAAELVVRSILNLVRLVPGSIPGVATKDIRAGRPMDFGPGPARMTFEEFSFLLSDNPEATGLSNAAPHVPPYRLNSVRTRSTAKII